MDLNQLEDRLRAALPDADYHLKDLTGSQDHFELRIVTKGFIGLSRIQRHRLIYDALKEHMGGDIHALALKTYTPEEWQQKQSQPA